ncbi:hypothetical protein FRC04_002422 [Tulasnella sp. 424]|nr:hypothetical protein FRC04_002422 [Tulasnella sp. 424]KAG8972848.1 hypothetical protein FRC05_009487 [Tulasnella sp. 425]
MIQCEECDSWQHGSCVGLSKEEDCPQRYYCARCRPDLHPRGTRVGDFPSAAIESNRSLGTGSAGRECRPHRRHGYRAGSSRGLLTRGTGTPPHPDISASSTPILPPSKLSAPATTETDPKPNRQTSGDLRTGNVGSGQALQPISCSKSINESGKTQSELGVESEAPGSTTKRLKPHTYQGSSIRNMLALSTYTQTTFLEEVKRDSIIEAFAARAAEVRLTDRDDEFDGQLVHEILDLREVAHPIALDPEVKKTLDLAEELSRDLLAFQERFGAGEQVQPNCARRERASQRVEARRGGDSRVG